MSIVRPDPGSVEVPEVCMTPEVCTKKDLMALIRPSPPADQGRLPQMALWA